MTDRKQWTCLIDYLSWQLSKPVFFQHYILWKLVWSITFYKEYISSVLVSVFSLASQGHICPDPRLPEYVSMVFHHLNVPPWVVFIRHQKVENRLKLEENLTFPLQNVLLRCALMNTTPSHPCWSSSAVTCWGCAVRIYRAVLLSLERGNKRGLTLWPGMLAELQHPRCSGWVSMMRVVEGCHGEALNSTLLFTLLEGKRGLWSERGWWRGRAKGGQRGQALFFFLWFYSQCSLLFLYDCWRQTLTWERDCTISSHGNVSVFIAKCISFHQVELSGHILCIVIY